MLLIFLKLFDGVEKRMKFILVISILLSVNLFFYGFNCDELASVSAAPKLCLSNPCQNGSFCIDASDNYICLCAPGFIGIK